MNEWKGGQEGRTWKEGNKIRASARKREKNGEKKKITWQVELEENGDGERGKRKKERGEREDWEKAEKKREEMMVCCLV